MRIGAIENGIVIDHITAGKGLELYHLLKLDNLDCAVAIIQNAASKKMGRKDIIKVGASIDVDMDILGYVDPNATVAIIRNGELVEKKTIELPLELRNVLVCKNPRCITSTEQELPQVFLLRDREKRVYRCMYCEAKSK
jgi:aspartate carbamoyltransferase regulatory subunit